VLVTEADVPRILSHLAEAEGSSGGSGRTSAPEPEVPPEPAGESPASGLDEPGQAEEFEG
jgi:hypothetical protein